eukprot:3962396-Prymnesium_polylepis.1
MMHALVLTQRPAQGIRAGLSGWGTVPYCVPVSINKLRTCTCAAQIALIAGTHHSSRHASEAKKRAVHASEAQRC